MRAGALAAHSPEVRLVLEDWVAVEMALHQARALLGLQIQAEAEVVALAVTDLVGLVLS
jgi:hypothetical protein